MSEWINCDDEMPNDHSYVVCINVNNGGRPFVAFRWDGIWVGTSNYQQQPTHWMPLPTPPSE